MSPLAMGYVLVLVVVVACSATLFRQRTVTPRFATAPLWGFNPSAAGNQPLTLDNIRLASELGTALQREQLVLHYQPKASLATGQVTEVEALIRWQHPDWGLLSPDLFTPLAERCGLIRPLSLWVLDAVLGQCQAWRDGGLQLTVAANLSIIDLQESALPRIIDDLLRRHRLAGRWLRVEITENLMMANLQRTLDVAHGLAELGVGLSLDDFGTGYSSLAHLRHLPVGEVKLDKVFIVDVAEDATSAAIVRSAIDLSHQLGLEVVAEGVESQPAWAVLRLLGCDIAQGFFISQPLPPQQLPAWLASYYQPCSSPRMLHQLAAFR